MKQITKQLKIIEKRNKLKKVRAEYHSFMRVRELKDINSSYELMSMMLRLEGNLVTAANTLEKAWKGR